MKSFGNVNKKRGGLLVLLTVLFMWSLSQSSFAEETDRKDKNTFSMGYTFGVYESIGIYYADGFLFVNYRIPQDKTQNFIKELSSQEQDGLFHLLDQIDFSEPILQDILKRAQEGWGNVYIDYKGEQIHFDYIPSEDSIYKNLTEYVFQIVPDALVEYKHGSLIKR